MPDTSNTGTRKRPYSERGTNTERTHALRLRVNETEKATIQAAAKSAGLTISQYLRRCAGLTGEGG